ncbi:MAG: hypothetical protein ACM31P_02785 [Actinomycetota bacterium]
MAGIHDDDFDIEQLRQGRNLLWAALAGAILSMPLLLIGKGAGFGIICWVVAFLGGAVGITKVSEALGGSVVLKWIGILFVLMPGWNIVPIGFFLLKANQAMKGDSEPAAPPEDERPSAATRSRTPESAQPRPAARAEAPPTPQPAAQGNVRDRVLRAVAHVKMAGLPDLPEGTQLQARITGAGVEIPDDDQPIFVASKGAFGVVYFIDEGEGFTYVTQGHLREAGISVQELHRIGLENLAGLLTGGQRKLKLQPLQQSAFGLILDGHFEASLVLLDQLWEGALKKYLPTAPVVAMPSRDVCSFCDGQSAQGIEILKGVAERVSQGGGHLISPQLFTRREGRWLALESAA